MQCSSRASGEESVQVKCQASSIKPNCISGIVLSGKIGIIPSIMSNCLKSDVEMHTEVDAGHQTDMHSVHLNKLPVKLHAELFTVYSAKCYKELYRELHAKRYTKLVSSWKLYEECNTWCLPKLKSLLQLNINSFPTQFSIYFIYNNKIKSFVNLWI